MTIIAERNHDSNGTVADNWTVVTTSTGISVAAGAALNGTAYGLSLDEASLSGNQRLRHSFTALSGDDFRMRIRVNFDNATQPGGEGTSPALIYEADDSAAGRAQGLITVFEDNAIANGWKIEFRAREDGQTSPLTVVGSTQSFSGETCIELAVIRATSDVASDGIARGYINGTLVAEDATLDNYDIWTSNVPDRLELQIIADANWGGTAYVDEVAFGDDSGEALCGPTPFRFLGMAADTEQLYIAGLQNGTLKLYTYSDLDSLTEGGTIHAFGAATDSDIDSLAKGIFPVTRPGADKVIYLFGRDGNDVHVQKNDLNGAGGWQDIGAGAPTWATTKMCIALMPDILDPDDLIAAFGDDDVYRSQDDGGAWVKMGDAPTTLRGGARHPLTDNELLLAGTTSGDPHYTHNFGVSFAGATDDDIIQTEEVRVAAGADDGWVDQGTPTFHDTLINVSMGQISGDDADAWFRFQNVQIPNGATITNAYIEFVASNTTTSALTLDIFAEDEDDPAAPSSVADYNARIRTTATINWDPGDWTADVTYQTDDIKTVIQEIVDRAGWAAGNAMQIFIEHSTGTPRRLAKSYEGSTTQAALLHIEYQVTGLINAIEYSL